MKFFKKPQALLLFLTLVCIFSCRHDIDVFVPDTVEIGQTVHAMPIQASVSGVVTDGNSNPVPNATVRSGSNTTTSDARGLFRFNRISLDKTAAVVTVESNGYFKAVRTFSALDGSTNYLKIKLVSKALAGTVQSATGGLVSLPGNAGVTLQPNSIIIKSSGLPYNGTVNVYAAAIDPAADDFYQTIPGSFQATDSNNFRVLLKSFAIMAVQLEAPSGEALQIAANHTAQLQFNIAASLSSNAPATIPLWWLDESTGLWKQEGTATKAGNSYTGLVAHFSFWNCGIAANTVSLEMKIATAHGPLPNAIVKITCVSTGAFSYATSDSTGNLSGLVFSNQPLQLQVLDACMNTVYSQTIGPYTTNTNIGTIMATLPTTGSITVFGSVLDCNAQPVTNGNAYIYWESQLLATPVSNGNFSVTLTRCSSTSTPIEVEVVDLASNQQASFSSVVTSDSINTGTLSACSVTGFDFISYTIDNNAYGILFPDSLTHSFGGNNIAVFSGRSFDTTLSISFSINDSTIATGSSQPLLSFNSLNFEAGAATVIPTPIQVAITNYGSIGQFIEGNFSGMIKASASGITHMVRVQFKVRRRF